VPVIIDGNNLLHSYPTDRRDRSSVRWQALDTVRHEGTSLTVVFDGPPPEGSPEVEHLGRLVVRYSGSSSADDVIVGLLASCEQVADWVVVTDDRALRNRVRERGAKVRTLREWRTRGSRKPRRATAEPKLSSRDIADWEAYFSSGSDDDTQR
jgi:predicted RNA-binding protein with PIN domain